MLTLAHMHVDVVILNELLCHSCLYFIKFQQWSRIKISFKFVKFRREVMLYDNLNQRDKGEQFFFHIFLPKNIIFVIFCLMPFQFGNGTMNFCEVYLQEP
jgi:hypothetical protein